MDQKERLVRLIEKRRRNDRDLYFVNDNFADDGVNTESSGTRDVRKRTSVRKTGKKTRTMSKYVGKGDTRVDQISNSASLHGQVSKHIHDLISDNRKLLDFEHSLVAGDIDIETVLAEEAKEKELSTMEVFDINKTMFGKFVTDDYDFLYSGQDRNGGVGASLFSTIFQKKGMHEIMAFATMDIPLRSKISNNLVGDTSGLASLMDRLNLLEPSTATSSVTTNTPGSGCRDGESVSHRFIKSLEETIDALNTVYGRENVMEALPRNLIESLKINDGEADNGMSGISSTDLEEIMGVLIEIISDPNSNPLSFERSTAWGADCDKDALPESDQISTVSEDTSVDSVTSRSAEVVCTWLLLVSEYPLQLLSYSKDNGPDGVFDLLWQMRMRNAVDYSKLMFGLHSRGWSIGMLLTSLEATFYSEFTRQLANYFRGREGGDEESFPHPLSDTAITSVRYKFNQTLQTERSIDLVEWLSRIGVLVRDAPEAARAPLSSSSSSSSYSSPFDSYTLLDIYHSYSLLIKFWRSPFLWFYGCDTYAERYIQNDRRFVENTADCRADIMNDGLVASLVAIETYIRRLHERYILLCSTEIDLLDPKTKEIHLYITGAELLLLAQLSFLNASIKSTTDSCSMTMMDDCHHDPSSPPPPPITTRGEEGEIFSGGRYIRHLYLEKYKKGDIDARKIDLAIRRSSVNVSEGIHEMCIKVACFGGIIDAIRDHIDELLDPIDIRLFAFTRCSGGSVGSSVKIARKETTMHSFAGNQNEIRKFPDGSLQCISKIFGNYFDSGWLGDFVILLEGINSAFAQFHPNLRWSSSFFVMDKDFLSRCIPLHDTYTGHKMGDECDSSGFGSYSVKGIGETLIHRRRVVIIMTGCLFTVCGIRDTERFVTPVFAEAFVVWATMVELYCDGILEFETSFVALDKTVKKRLEKTNVKTTIENILSTRSTASGGGGDGDQGMTNAEDGSAVSTNSRVRQLVESTKKRINTSRRDPQRGISETDLDDASANGNNNSTKGGKHHTNNTNTSSSHDNERTFF
jgi:hypothetical protein